MREFDKILINSKEHSNLLGSFESYDGELIIQAENHTTVKVFRDFLRNRIRVNELTFEKSDDFVSSFTGPYLIRKIEGDIIHLHK